MNNFILISKTFDEITPESAEDSDFSDSGFITEREEVTFRELVDLMSEHPIPSCSPDNGDTNTCYSTEYYVTDYHDLTQRQESIHYHKDNTPNAAKYWRLARKIAYPKKIQP